MDTNRLRQFCLIVETGSLSRAAELIHITHSGLSKSMSHLQEELKTVLFQPSGRGITVTHDGMRIYHNAKQFLATEADLFFSKKQEAEREYSIGSVEIFLASLTQGLKKHPLAAGTLKILDVEPGIMEQQIVSGKLDVGISYLPFPTEQLKMIPIGTFKLGCFYRSDAFEGVDITKIPFAVPAKVLPENPLGIKERDGWHDSLVPRTIGYRVNLLATALQLCLEGQCAVYMPQFVARAINESHFGKGSAVKLKEHALPALAPKSVQTAYALCHNRSVEDANFRKVCMIIRRAIH